MNDSLNVLTLFLFNIVLVNIPLLYGTVGEIVTEKAGSLNLGVEGTMAVGAMFGYLAGCAANSILVGLLVAFLSAGLCGLLFAVLTVSFQANQNVTGLTITTFGLGLYFFVGKGMGENWPAMVAHSNLVKGFNAVEIPGLSSIPVIGKAFFSHNMLVYLGVIIAVAIWWYMNYTKTGLRLRSGQPDPDLDHPGGGHSEGIRQALFDLPCPACGNRRWDQGDRWARRLP